MILTLANTVRTERVRDFQPTWRTVYVIRCPQCGHETRVVKNWRGPSPPMGIVCGCGGK